MIWTITGEAGKALDDAPRRISEVAQDPVLSFKGLAVDTLTFSRKFSKPDMSDLVAPEAGQRVSVYADGIRQFTGIVLPYRITVSDDGGSVKIQAVGPWWGLAQVPLSSIVIDQTGASSERSVFALDGGTVQGGISTLLSRARSLGVPLLTGAISTCYEIPPVAFSSVSFADAIAELVRWVPDSMVWVDYSGSGDPRFRLSRRDSAQVLSLPLGQPPLQSATLTPMASLQTEQVVVQSAYRRGDGLTVYQSQSSGATSLTKRQVVIVSGPEVGSPLESPQRPLETMAANKFRAYNIGPFDTRYSLIGCWQDLKAAANNTNTDILAIPVIRGCQNGVGWDYAVAPTFFNSEGETIHATASLNVMTSNNGEFPAWIEEVAGATMGFCKGTFSTVFSFPAGGGFDAFESEMISHADHFTQVDLGATLELTCFFNLEIPMAFFQGATSGSEITPATYTQPLDVQFAQPPAALASDLCAAQAFLPYSGTVTLKSADHLSSYLGRTLNITQGPPEWANAKALIQGAEIDLLTLTQTLTLGSPQRLSLTNRLSRVRRNRDANTVQL